VTAPETVELFIAARAENVALARLALVGVATSVEASPEEIADLKLAVSEVCTNAVVHAYRDTEGYVLLRFTAADGTVTVEVADTGVGFDPAALPPQADGDEATPVSARLGLVITRAIADELSVESGDAGSRVVFSKRLGSASP
jgi:serine/threonine-protein kinase RsbW